MNDKKIALVTGANSGMGSATAVALARQGFRVIMLCRDEKRGGAALAAARAAASTGMAGGRTELELAICDLGRAASVRRFAAELHSKIGSLDVLVNNAGVISPKRLETEDGFELQLGVNHLGHFLLTNLLLDLVVKAKGRIVVVASGAHKIGRIHWDDLQLQKGYSAFGSYGQSKLANVLFARELSKRLMGTGVVVNSLHPGAVATSLGVNRRTGFGGFVTGILKPFFLTPEQGADTAIYLATSPEAAGVSGRYFYRRKSAKASTRAEDDEAAARLWKVSEELTSSAGLGAKRASGPRTA
jgi:NAD(P)-dependent dehydrogenase (short-subunit alcohol dehydrogenase family)